MTLLDRIRAGAVALAATVSLLSAPAKAETMQFAFDGVETIKGDEGTEATKGTHVSVKWNGELQLGLLGGEPLVSLRFKFAPSTGRVTLPILGARLGEPYFEQHRYQDLPQDLREKLRLIDIKIRMSFFSAAGMVDLVVDVGASGAPGEWYFNVPGSPDWGKLFLREHAREVWIGEGVAKSIWESGLTLSSVRIEEGDLTLYDMHEAYMKEGGRERYRVMGRAYERLAEGLKRSYGIDVSRDKRAWSQAHLDASQNDIGDPDAWRRRADELRALLDKLARLPQQMRAGDNHAPYDQAVKDATGILNGVDYEIAAYEPMGVDPDTIEKGRAPEFGTGGPRFVFVKSSWARKGAYVYALKQDGSLGDRYDVPDLKSRLVNDLVVMQGSVYCGIGQSIRDRAAVYPEGTPVDLSMVDCPARDYEWYVSAQDDQRYSYDRETGSVEKSYGGDYFFHTAEGFEISLRRDIKGSSRHEDIATYYFDRNFKFLRVERH